MPLIELRIESKSQTNQSFDNRVTRILFDSNTSKMMNKVGIRKALTMAQTISITRKYNGL